MPVTSNSENQGDNGSLRAFLRRLWAEGSVAWIVGVLFAVILLEIDPSPHGLSDEVRRARQETTEGDWLAASQAYRAAASYEPWVPDHLSAAAEAALRAGEYDAALDDLIALRRARPLTPQEMLWLGAVYDHQGRLGDALEAWEIAIAGQAYDPEILRHLVDIYRADEDYYHATQALRILARHEPTDHEVLRELTLLQSLIDPEGACITMQELVAAYEVSALTSALDTCTTQPPDQIYIQLGIAFVELREWELAEVAFEHAVAYNPASAHATAYLGYVRGRLGEPGLSALAQAMALAPDDPLVFTLTGLYLERLGAWPEARSALEWAYGLDPRNPAIAVEIANTYRAEGGYRWAELWLQEAVRLAPDDLRFELLLAEFYIDESYRVQEVGLPLAQELVERAPRNAEARAVLSSALLYAGDFDGARREVQTALRLDPDLGRAHYQLALIHEIQGRPVDAIRHYRLAAEYDPEGQCGALARRALERLTGEVEDIS